MRKEDLKNGIHERCCTDVAIRLRVSYSDVVKAWIDLGLDFSQGKECKKFDSEYTRLCQTGEIIEAT
jgi:hypothetical protein